MASSRGKPLGDIFGATQASGWDECFPTVLECDGIDFGWNGPLRDHGMLWGRPWKAETRDGCLETIFENYQFRFVRRLTLVGSNLIADYSLINANTKPFGYLYSQHMLLALNPGEILSFNGVGPFSGTHMGAGDAPRDSSIRVAGLTVYNCKIYPRSRSNQTLCKVRWEPRRRRFNAQWRSLAALAETRSGSLARLRRLANGSSCAPGSHRTDDGII